MHGVPARLRSRCRRDEPINAPPSAWSSRGKPSPSKRRHLLHVRELALDDVLGLARQLRLDVRLEPPQQKGAQHLVQPVDDKQALLLRHGKVLHRAARWPRAGERRREPLRHVRVAGVSVYSTHGTHSKHGTCSQSTVSTVSIASPQWVSPR